MLRTEDGTRVFDAHDIDVLLRLEEIQFQLSALRLRRLRRLTHPQTDRELHFAEHGHELEFGCCKRAA